METAEHIIRALNLIPHPEGGFFKETYRSSGQISQAHLGNDFQGRRNFSTCIYFLLLSEAFSAFHRIKQDEIWHFYKGAPIHLHMISPTGEHSKVDIGNDMNKGQQPQYVVPAYSWFAAEVSEANSFSLVGCTVSPGFDFDDFELAARNKLISKFPAHEMLIKRFTRE